MSNIIILIEFATGTGNANSKYLIKILLLIRMMRMRKIIFVYQFHNNATLACYLKKICFIKT